MVSTARSHASAWTMHRAILEADAAPVSQDGEENTATKVTRIIKQEQSYSMVDAMWVEENLQFKFDCECQNIYW